MIRSELLYLISKRVLTIERPHPVRVAIDGVDAAGKTILADELAERMRSQGLPVIRAGIDGFHYPRAIRYRRGPDSPDGYFLDSFNLERLRTELLDPLGPGGSGLYRLAIFDHRADVAVDAPPKAAEPHAILLFDGVFLLRTELRACWDLAIFVKADFAVTLERALNRDLVLFGSRAEVARRYEARYGPAQRIYLRKCCPAELADIVIDNNDPANPKTVKARTERQGKSPVGTPALLQKEEAPDPK